MNRIQIPTSYGYNHFLPFTWQEVIRMEGQNNYTLFVLQNGKKYTSTKTLGSYEAFLPPEFVRIHKGCIVHQASIEQVCETTKRIILTDGFTHPVARRRWGELKKEVLANNDYYQ